MNEATPLVGYSRDSPVASAVNAQQQQQHLASFRWGFLGVLMGTLLSVALHAVAANSSSHAATTSLVVPMWGHDHHAHHDHGSHAHHDHHEHHEHDAGSSSFIEKTTLSPSSWLRTTFSVSQGVLSTGPPPTRRLRLAGQTASSIDNGETVLAPGDMAGQISIVTDRIDTLLAEADMTVADITSVLFFSTSVDDSLEAWQTWMDWVGESAPPVSLIGVDRLYLPGLLIEVVVEAEA